MKPKIGLISGDRHRPRAGSQAARQIALKLSGFERGVSVQGGILFPVTIPAHGTAFDIAGQGRANVGATRASFHLACDMATNWT